ncbi:MAG: hypothetical protein GXO86_11620 [Chlorobi bacterium]|nr:hypothetical protein [Chlorobiota bacterium]
MWDRFFNRDQFWFGLLVGLIFPAVLFLILYSVDMLAMDLWNTHIMVKQEYLYILSLVVNLLTIRYYFVNLKYDKTGRGILLVTFVLGITYFVLFLG